MAGLLRLRLVLRTGIGKTGIAAASHALAGRLAEAQEVMVRLRQFDRALRLSTLEEIIAPLRRADDRPGIWRGGVDTTAGCPSISGLLRHRALAFVRF